MAVEEDFWHWFLHHQHELLSFEQDRDRIFDSLASQLRKIDSRLVFEFGPREVKREFVISADGILAAFPAVVSLVDAAPDMPDWKITAFRPRRAAMSIIEIQEKRVDPKLVEFSLLHNDQVAGIRLFIPSFQEEDAGWKAIGYLLLDEALGEYDVETRLGLIKMYSPNASTAETRYPFELLPRLFDQLIAKIEGKSGKPS
jgi:hypothetical protein